MRRASIRKFITNTSVAVGLGAATLFGGVAHADTFYQRLQTELNSGKDYSAAWAEASKAAGPLYASDLTPDRNRALGAMNDGRDYSAAWQVASRPTQAVFSPEQVAKARQARDQMNEGKDYATGYEQPVVRIQASSGRARSTK